MFVLPLGKSDPYAVITYERFRVKSKIIKNTLNPTWNEVFTFDINTKNTDTCLSSFPSLRLLPLP